MSPITRSGITLAAIAAVCTALVATTWRLTVGRIAANEQAYLEASLSPALAGVSYDSGLLESPLVIPEPHELPASGPALVYRVFDAAAAPVRQAVTH